MNHLLLDIAQITENAAIECHNWIGKGDEKSADSAAVRSMRDSLNSLKINGKVIIGEGERDKAPMLYIGEILGIGDIDIDIAVDPLEGTTICANNLDGAMSVIAISKKDKMLSAPDVYMDKIAIGANLPEDIIDLNNSLKKNLSNLAKAKKCLISDLSVTVLKRERHDDLIAKIRDLGTKIKLIDDGDIAAVISTVNNNVDMYVGIGGAPEGILAAAALKTLGGQITCKLIFSDESEKIRARSMGILDLNRHYRLDDLIRDDVIFSATGITDGELLDGVKKNGKKFTTNTILLDSKTKSSRYIKNQTLILQSTKTFF